MELVILFASMVIAVSSLALLYSVKHIRDTYYYKPKRTRATYIRK